MILKGRFCLPCYPDLSCPRWLPQSITWTSQLLTSNKKESETSSEACDVGAYGQKKVGGRTDLWSDWRGRLFRPLNKPGCGLQIFILSMYNYCNAHIFEYIRIISANATVFWTHMCYRLKFIRFVETLSSFRCYCQSSFFCDIFLGNFTKVGIGVPHLDGGLGVPEEESVCRDRLLGLVRVTLLPPLRNLKERSEDYDKNAPCKGQSHAAGVPSQVTSTSK